MIHGVREQRKECAKERPHEGIDRNRAVGVETITVDEIAHTLPEWYHTPQSDQRCGKNLWDPGAVGVARPCEPEQPDRKRNSAHDHWW